MNDLKLKHDKSPHLHSFFEETEGGYSMTRLLQFAFFMPLFAVMTYVGIKTKAWPILPDSYVMLASAFLGFGGLNKFIEVKGSTDKAKVNADAGITPPTPNA